MYNYLKIGPVNLSVSISEQLPWKDEVKVFQIPEQDEREECVQYTVEFVKTFEPIWGNVLYSNGSMIVMDVDGKEYRIHLLSSTNEPFALIEHVSNAKISILIDERMIPALKWDRNLVGLFSLEHVCLLWNAFLLHASYIIYHDQAIVFTAPSGTGKSTQAELWKKYENAEIINGDRTLIMFKDGKWFASGFPVCGSSPYCKNKTAAIKAIVCLEQGLENDICELSPIKALGKIYSQAFVNKWNPNDCNRISMHISSLVQAVSVYHYSCTKDEKAVLVLKDKLNF